MTAMDTTPVQFHSNATADPTVTPLHTNATTANPIVMQMHTNATTANPTVTSLRTNATTTNPTVTSLNTNATTANPTVTSLHTNATVDTITTQLQSNATIDTTTTQIYPTVNSTVTHVSFNSTLDPTGTHLHTNATRGTHFNTTVGKTEVTAIETSTIFHSKSTEAPTNSSQGGLNSNSNVSTDCSKILGLSIGVAAVVWFLTVVIFLVILLRMRHRWKRRLRDERQRTDIWSLSTYHNTIINENFLDYKLAAPSDSYRISDSKNSNKNTARLKQSRLSSGALSGRSSASYNDDFSFRQSFIRRDTINYDERHRFRRSRSRLKRQRSSQSSDYWLEHSSSGSEIRPRTSTFNIGKRDKHDKHVLLNHDVLHLTGSRSMDNLEMLECRSREESLSSSPNQGPLYVTEL